jgi:hypothetical protein
VSVLEAVVPETSLPEVAPTSQGHSGLPEVHHTQPTPQQFYHSRTPSFPQAQSPASPMPAPYSSGPGPYNQLPYPVVVQASPYAMPLPQQYHYPAQPVQMQYLPGQPPPPPAGPNHGDTKLKKKGGGTAGAAAAGVGVGAALCCCMDFCC